MQPRLDYFRTAPTVMQPMLAMERQSRESGLEPSLIGLVKVRASQINGCAFCIHMHTLEARAQGERELRLLLLDAWRESPLFTERERAALAWTEALTLVARTHAPDADYERLRAQFGAEEQVKLTQSIVTINAWNRFAIAFRSIHPVDEPADHG